MAGQAIDWAKVRALHQEVGEDGLIEVIELFLQEVEMVLAVLGGRGRQFREDMHFLKGCAANLGFSEMAELCARNERSELDPSLAASAVGAVKQCYRESRMAFFSQIGAGLSAS